MTPHVCRSPYCEKEVHPRNFCCPEHWRQLPLDVRIRIKAAYREGQEMDRCHSREYIDATAAAIRIMGVPAT